MKPKACRSCRGRFTPTMPFQDVCGYECGLALVRTREARKAAQAKRQEAREHRKKLLAIKPRKWWAAKARDAFHKWIRLRDRDLPCVSCPAVEAKWDAGHYRSVGAQPALRFEPLNVHKQCAQCNQKKSGNGIEYGIRLAQRIGADKLAWLEQEHAPKKYTIPELQAIEAEYKAKVREIM